MPVTAVSEELKLPAELSSGSWHLFLYLPDETLLLTGRPEYSIRLANKDMWEEATGYNDLHHVLTIR